MAQIHPGPDDIGVAIYNQDAEDIFAKLTSEQARTNLWRLLLAGGEGIDTGDDVDDKTLSPFIPLAEKLQEFFHKIETSEDRKQLWLKLIKNEQHRPIIFEIIVNDPNLMQYCDSSKLDEVRLAEHLSVLDIKLEFAMFFRERRHEKLELYRLVVVIGAWLVVISIIIIIAWGTLSILEDTWYSYDLDVLQVVGAFFRVTGLSIYSTVPTYEFDLFYMMTRPNNWMFLWAFCGVATIGCFIAGGTQIIGGGFGYAWFMLILVGLWWFANIVWTSFVTYPRFVLLVQVFLIVSLTDQAFSDLSTAFSGSTGNNYYIVTPILYFLCALFILGITIVYFNKDRRRMLVDPTHRPAVSSASSSQLVAGRDISLKQESQYSGKDMESQKSTVSILDAEKQKGQFNVMDRGWGADAINSSVYSLCVVVGIIYIISGITEASSGQPLSNYIVWYIAAVADLGPLIVLAIITPKKAFTLLARWFEKRPERLEKDGAFLSALVKLSTTSADGAEVWVKRNTKDRVEYYGDAVQGCVDRGFWMLGNVHVSHARGVTTTVTYDKDVDVSWQKYYSRSKLVDGIPASGLVTKTTESAESTASTTSKQVVRPMAPPSTNAWLVENFDIKKEHMVAYEPTCVVSLVEQPSAAAASADNSAEIRSDTIQFLFTQQKLLQASAKKLLREFKWPGIKVFKENKLFLTSPREMGNEAERSKIYSLSQPADPRKKKIDFFISHSWLDDAKWKEEALSKFAEDFKKRHFRYPTFWFDKVCIDQNNPSDGIAVLPINIGACEGVLVLLGPTYMSRLWCIWELFSLFTFCNRELALERLKIIPVHDGKSVVNLAEQVNNFNIDNAHCFDPNEEFKLRHLMIDVIGDKELTESLKTIQQHEEHIKAVPVPVPVLSGNCLTSQSKPT